MRKELLCIRMRTIVTSSEYRASLEILLRQQGCRYRGNTGFTSKPFSEITYYWVSVEILLTQSAACVPSIGCLLPGNTDARGARGTEVFSSSFI